MKQVIIAIAGGTASGKTTIAQKIYDATKEFGSVCMIRMDDYYVRLDHLTLEERKKINYDHPNSYDTKLFFEHLQELKHKKSIKKPIYDFVAHNRSQETEIIKPADVIIVEGIMLFAIVELLPLYDIKVFVETPDDVRFIRRLQRDTVSRGRSMDSVIQQYISTVRPMHLQFVEPSKRYADLIVPEGGHNNVAIDILVSKIHAILKS